MSDRKPVPPADLDDNPEWTRRDFARARPASEVLGQDAAAALVKRSGRPTLPAGERKERITIRLSPDVLAAYRATGAGWQGRIDETLRTALRRDGVHKEG
jgi:uncharacterized protein (DUF4415 family)